MAIILMLLPDTDSATTEVAVPSFLLTRVGHQYDVLCLAAGPFLGMHQCLGHGMLQGTVVAFWPPA
jgi:hypothetical protein